MFLLYQGFPDTEISVVPKLVGKGTWDLRIQELPRLVIMEPCQAGEAARG